MANLRNQPTSLPTRKVGGGAVIGTPLGVIVVWTLNTFVLPQVPSPTGDPVTIPPEIAAAIGSVLSFLASYFVKEQA